MHVGVGELAMQFVAAIEGTSEAGFHLIPQSAIGLDLAGLRSGPGLFGDVHETAGSDDDVAEFRSFQSLQLFEFRLACRLGAVSSFIAPL